MSGEGIGHTPRTGSHFSFSRGLMVYFVAASSGQNLMFPSPLWSNQSLWDLHPSIMPEYTEKVLRGNNKLFCCLHFVIFPCHSLEQRRVIFFFLMEKGEKTFTLQFLFRMVFLKITPQEIHIIFLKIHSVFSPGILTTQKLGSLTPSDITFMLYFLTKFVSTLYFDLHCFHWTFFHFSDSSFGCVYSFFIVPTQWTLCSTAVVLNLLDTVTL